MRKPLMPGDRVRCRETRPCPGHRIIAAIFYRDSQTVKMFPDPCGYSGGATVSASGFVRLPRARRRSRA